MKRFSPAQGKRIGTVVVIGATLVALLGTCCIAAEAEPPVAPHTPDGSAEEAAPPAETIPYITPEEMERFIAGIAEAGADRDPFLTSGEQEWKRFLGELKERPPCLKGIIQLKDAHVALIDDSRFREGDEVKGFRIIEIEEERVVLTKGGEIFSVPLVEQ